MSAEHNMTPSDILQIESAARNQEVELKEFEMRVKRFIAHHGLHPETCDTFDGKVAAYEQGSRLYQLSVLSELLQYLISNEFFDKGFNVDEFDSLENASLEIHEGVPLKDTDVQEAIQAGREKGNNDFFDLLSTEEVTDSGKRPLPLNRWKKDFAKKRLSSYVESGSGHSFAVLPTSVPGVEVILNYKPGENIPTREVCITDILNKEDEEESSNTFYT